MLVKNSDDVSFLFQRAFSHGHIILFSILCKNHCITPLWPKSFSNHSLNLLLLSISFPLHLPSNLNYPDSLSNLTRFLLSRIFFFKHLFCNTLLYGKVAKFRGELSLGNLFSFVVSVTCILPVSLCYALWLTSTLLAGIITSWNQEAEPVTFIVYSDYYGVNV